MMRLVPQHILHLAHLRGYGNESGVFSYFLEVRHFLTGNKKALGHDNLGL